MVLLVYRYRIAVQFFYVFKFAEFVSKPEKEGTNLISQLFILISLINRKCFVSDLRVLFWEDRLSQLMKFFFTF